MKIRHLKILTTTLYSRKNLRRKMVILHIGNTDTSFEVLYPFHTGVISPCHVIIFQKLFVSLCFLLVPVCVSLLPSSTSLCDLYPYSLIAQIPSWCKFHLYMLGGGYSLFDEHPTVNCARSCNSWYPWWSTRIEFEKHRVVFKYFHTATYKGFDDF